MTAALLVAKEFWYVLVFAALGVWIGLLYRQIDDQMLEHQKLVVQVTQHNLDRERVARKHEETLAQREQEHAAAQQEKDNAHATQTAALRTLLATERTRATGLRDQLHRITTRSSAGSETDPVACGSALDRLETLGGLAGEGVELLAEGRGLLQQRDLDVQRLREQIDLDRAACGQAE